MVFNDYNQLCFRTSFLLAISNFTAPDIFHAKFLTKSLHRAWYSPPRTRSIQSYCVIHSSWNLHTIVERWFEIQLVQCFVNFHHVHMDRHERRDKMTKMQRLTWLVQSSNYASSIWFSDISHQLVSTTAYQPKVRILWLDGENWCKKQFLYRSLGGKSVQTKE
jgi:hypothetical protein